MRAISRLGAALGAVGLVAAVLGLYTARASHEMTGVPRPAHVPASTAHESSLPSGAATGMTNGYDYWNLVATQRTVNSYQSPVQYSPSSKYDLVASYVAGGQTACLYDLNHCYSMPTATPVPYAVYLKYQDLNVGHVVWNASLYPTPFPDVDGLQWRSVVGRHELGHDQRLGDHSESGYEGLMCNTNTCTRKSAASTAELDTAASTFQARPIPASSISVGTVTSTTVTISFSGHGNADQLVPARSTSLTGWTELSPIAAGSTSYQFTDLTPSTTYNFRIVSRKSGQPDGSSHWVAATTSSIGRVTGFIIDAYNSGNMKLQWSSLPGAVSYERCVSNSPTGGSWVCVNVGNTTSQTTSIPSTSSKGVWYYAVRGVDANGTRGALSNRGTISRFNETVSGTVYNSYHTAYKDSSGTKKVNGYNRQSSSRYLAFSNGTSGQEKKGLVSGNNKWFSQASSWTAADQSTMYGPVITAIESPNSSLSPQDAIAHSTICMVIGSGC